MVGYVALVVAVAGGGGQSDELVADLADAVVACSVTVGSAQIDFQAAVGAGNYGQFRPEEITAVAIVPHRRWVAAVVVAPEVVGGNQFALGKAHD